MKRSINIIALAAAILACASCAKEETGLAPAGLRFSTEIDTELLISKSGDVDGQTVDVKSAQASYSMKAEISKMAPESGATKGLLTDGITGFTAAGYNGTTQCFAPQNVETGRTYNYDWPKGESRTFYASNASGITPSFTKDGVSLQFTSLNFPTTAATQSDVVLGWYSGDGKVDGSYAGVAAMKFKHVMSAVRIVNNTSLTITSIKLSGVNNAGTVSCNASGDITWTGKGGSETVSQENESGLAEDGDRVVGEPFILIPQDFSSSPMSVTIKDNAGSEYSGSLNCRLDCGDICTITLQQVAGAPVILNFRSEDKTTEIRWTKCPGCDAYEYSINNGANWVRIDGDSNNSIVFTNQSYDTSFPFSVRSVLDDTPSEISSLEIHTAPAPPTNFRILGRTHTDAQGWTPEKNKLCFSAKVEVTSDSEIRIKVVVETTYQSMVGAYSCISDEYIFEPSGMAYFDTGGGRIGISSRLQLDDFIICDPDYSDELGYTMAYCYKKYPKGEVFSRAVPLGDEDIWVSDLPLLPY